MSTYETPTITELGSVERLHCGPGGGSRTAILDFFGTLGAATTAPAAYGSS